MEEKEFGEFPFERGPLIGSLSRVANHAKVKAMLASIEKQLTDLSERLRVANTSAGDAKNPRQVMLYNADLILHRKLEAQRKRFEDKLAELEEYIKMDIEYSNKLQHINTDTERSQNERLRKDVPGGTLGG